MAERPSRKMLTASELILLKLKETFEQNENITNNSNGTNVWVLLVAARPFVGLRDESLPYIVQDQIPSHQVKIVLRTSDAETGPNPYVDGTDLILAIDEKQQTADFVWEEETLGDAPHFHGGERELKTLDMQKQRYFALYESDTIDNDILVERINELKSKYDVLANRKSEAERQLDENQAAPIPLQLVRKALSDFNGLLQTSPVETQKTLIQTIVKQIAVQQGQKLRGIELEFDETLRQCLVVAAPSTNKVNRAFSLSRYRHPSPFTIVI